MEPYARIWQFIWRLAQMGVTSWIDTNTDTYDVHHNINTYISSNNISASMGTDWYGVDGALDNFEIVGSLSVRCFLEQFVIGIAEVRSFPGTVFCIHRLRCDFLGYCFERFLEQNYADIA
jgi:hypothetical protein